MNIKTLIGRFKLSPPSDKRDDYIEPLPVPMFYMTPETVAHLKAVAAQMRADLKAKRSRQCNT